MPLEELKKIETAEETARKIKQDATAAAEQMTTEALRSGEEAVRLAKLKARQEIEKKSVEAEAVSQSDAAANYAEIEKKKIEMRRQAESKMEAAAQLIVERIVNS